MKKALLFGVVVGLLASLFEGMYMLIPDLFIPSALYPLILMVFNVALWAVVSGIAAVITLCFFKGRKNRDYIIIIVCFIVFVFFYGLAGRIYLSQMEIPKTYDSHASFLWAALIVLVLIWSEHRKKTLHLLQPMSLIIELSAVIVIFNICTNLNVSIFVSLLHDVLMHRIVADYNLYLRIVYFFIIAAVLGGYVLYAIKGTRIYRASPVKFIGMLIITCAVLCSNYQLNRMTLSGRTARPVTGSSMDTQKKISNIILIVLDTVRADRLSALMRNGIAKNLQAFSQEAMVFTNCFAPSPWTFPSHASLFTGLYPSEHGADYDISNNSSIPRPLDDSFLTLAEIFEDSGYATAAVVSNRVFFRPELNIGQGFHHRDISCGIGTIYSRYPFHPLLHIFCCVTHLFPKLTLFYRTAEDMNNCIFRMLDRLEPSPFFLFVNYLDAHEPYVPPRPFNDLYHDRGLPQVRRIAQLVRKMFHRQNKRTWDPFLLSQYDGEIAYLDRQLGDFFNELKRRGLYDRALIVITSDHGEMIGEHGLYSHKTPLYEEVMRVPLMIKMPLNYQSGQRNDMLTLVDLFPTILALCDLPVPENISGKIFGGDETTVVAEFFHHTTGEHRAIRDARYKYMRYSISRPPELYDLREDPRETKNLASVLPEIAEGMDKKLHEWTLQHKKRAFVDTIVSPEVQQGLKSLGYIQ